MDATHIQTLHRGIYKADYSYKVRKDAINYQITQSRKTKLICHVAGGAGAGYTNDIGLFKLSSPFVDRGNIL